MWAVILVSGFFMWIAMYKLSKSSIFAGVVTVLLIGAVIVYIMAVKAAPVTWQQP